MPATRVHYCSLGRLADVHVQVADMPTRRHKKSTRRLVNWANGQVAENEAISPTIDKLRAWVSTLCLFRQTRAADVVEIEMGS